MKDTRTFTTEDLVTVYFAAYDGCGDVWMLKSLDAETLREYEYLRSEGELGDIHSAEILKGSDFHNKVIEDDEYLKEQVQEMREEKEND